MNDKASSGYYENSVQEILKKLSDTQRDLEEKLKALGVNLEPEEKKIRSIKFLAGSKIGKRNP